MTRTCPHCHEELPDFTEAELAEILGGLELTRALEPEPPQPQGLGVWLQTDEGPAFAIDPGAVATMRAARLREHAEQRRHR